MSHVFPSFSFYGSLHGKVTTADMKSGNLPYVWRVMGTVCTCEDGGERCGKAAPPPCSSITEPLQIAALVGCSAPLRDSPFFAYK